MAGERHLARRREDADAATHSGRVAGNTNIVSAWFISRAIACISRVVEATAVEEHGQPVAGEDPVGEDVDLDELEFARHARSECRENE